MRKAYALLGAVVFLALGAAAYLFYNAIFAAADSKLAVTRINALYFMLIVVVGGLLLLVSALKAVLERQLNLDEVKKEESSALGAVDLGAKMEGLENAIAAEDRERAEVLYDEVMMGYERLASRGMGETDSKETYLRIQGLYQKIVSMEKGDSGKEKEAAE